MDGAVFITDIAARFRGYQQLGHDTLMQMTNDQVHWRPSPDSNSIAIIVQHVYGNMMSRFTQFLTEDGEKPWRKRDAEFEPMDLTRNDLLDMWATGWSQVLHAVESLQDKDLATMVTIRQQPLRAYDALLRQLGHYAYHTGQMVTLGHMMLDDQWKSLSIPKGGSAAYNSSLGHKG